MVQRCLPVTCFAALSASGKNEFWATLALRHTPGIGPRRAKRLMQSYGTALAAAEAGLERSAEWTERGLVSAATARNFSSEKWRAKAKQEWAAVKSSDCDILCWSDANYPQSLREIDDPPLVLYSLGDVSLLHGPSVGVVGARDCTREGVAVSAFFARDLSRAGVTIISGMAKGIDRAAHVAGLEGVGGSIAVLGTGVDIAYPTSNADLYGLLREKGLLLSEFAPGVQAAAAHFPVRNRLISALSQGILVVEAAGRSGSLITARLALEQNRDVFAVPGHTMAAVSEGCRELIRRGAKPVFRADDILQELAPLLTYEARKSLDQRQEERGRQKRTHARNRQEEPFHDILNEAEAVLPEGTLPWLPAEGSRRGKASPARKPASKEAALSGAVPVPVAAAAFDVSGEHALAGPAAALTGDEARVSGALTLEPRHIDDLARMLDMDVAKLSGLLTLLEVRGLVRRAPGMLYSLPGA